MTINKWNKLLNIIPIFVSSSVLCSMPVSQNINISNYAIKTKMISSNKINNYDFTPINNFVNPYQDSFVATLHVDYQNEFEGENSFSISNNKISFHNTKLDANKYIFSNANIPLDSKSNKVINFSPVINDFINPTKITSNNNDYGLITSNNLSRYSALLKCGKKHVGRKVCSDPKHLHNRGCTTSYWYECPGCINGTKDVSFTKSFSNTEYSNLLKSSMILNPEFQFGKLLKINKENYIKSFDKTFLTIDYNSDYLRAVMMGSFNLAYATDFYLNYSWPFSDSLKEFIASAILQNKITIFDGVIPKYFEYNELNYNEMHNIRYWIENSSKFTEEYIKETISKLEILDFGKFINEKNIEINNYFLGRNLYKIFKDENILKNIVFDIKFELGENNKYKSHTISLLDLINNKNNKLVYNYNENINSIRDDFQDIGIDSIVVKSINQEVVYVQNYHCGFYFEENGLLEYKKPIPNLSNNEFFKKQKNLASLFTPVNYDKNKGKEILIKNKIFGLASENINEFNFGIFSKFDEYIIPIDQLILSNISNDSFNFLNSVLKKIIQNYEMIPNDNLGIINIRITFVDDSVLEYQIKGFDELKNINIKIINESLNYSNINLKHDFALTKEYILNNLIKYKNDYNDDSLYLFSTDLSKDEFIKVLKDIYIDIEKNNYTVKLIIDDNNLNKNHVFFIKNDLLNYDNNSFKNVDSKADNYLIGIYISVPIVILIILSSLLFVILKRKHKQKNL